jgi:hypothetical protein
MLVQWAIDTRKKVIINLISFHIHKPVTKVYENVKGTIQIA